ncbi:MAG: germination protein YpeB [Clostridia bacterium]|nr:germination protein YpeB [Clostridia bacterium]
MDKKIKKNNSAIDKAEMIANKEFQTVNQFQGGMLNTGFTQPNTVPVLPPVGVDKSAEVELSSAKQDRISAEKHAKLQLKAKKQQERARLKKMKAEKKALLKNKKADEKAFLKKVKTEQKHEHRQKRSDKNERRRDSKRKRGLGGWIVAVVSLGCVSLVLSSLLAISVFTDYMEFGKVNTNSSSSQRAFYDFVGYVDNMETNMSKLFVSSDSQGQQKILLSLAVQSNLADAALSELPIMDESKHLTSKYINQVGDYAKYLNNRLIEGYSLTDNEIDSMRELYNVNLNLKNVLSDLASNIDENYDFSALSKNDANDKIISQFKDIESNAMEYPSMIYDGAFSDGLEGKTAKAIIGDDITELEAIEIYKNLFSRYGIEKIDVTGMVENSGIICYNIISETKENGEVYAQISKTGGKLIMFNAYRDCNGLNVGEEECVALAEEFITSLGINNMTCVWTYTSGATAYLNFAYEENGIIAYPDLIKIKVCRERGVVSGIDTDEYYMNHVVRQIDTPKYTLSEALEKVNNELEIRSYSTAIIPTGGGNEKLAYEFIGDYNGESYYVYLDANTLMQADIFKVVNTEQGRLLI